MKKELRKVSYKEDYLLANLIGTTYQDLHNIIARMQEQTKYCDAYEKAFKQYEKVLKELKILEDTLVDTLKNRKEN